MKSEARDHDLLSICFIAFLLLGSPPSLGQAGTGEWVLAYLPG